MTKFNILQFQKWPQKSFFELGKSLQLTKNSFHFTENTKLLSMASTASEENGLKMEANNLVVVSNPNSNKSNPTLPPDSPLLRPSTPQSPGSRRAREIQREARRARNFRDSLERSGSRSRGGTPARSTPTPKTTTTTAVIPGEELSFSVKPNLGTRKGWKIMPESGDPDPEILQRVIDMIHEMEFSGRAIPERITLKV